ncbi:MAG: phosphonate ABC transporter ATP-binding protein [Bdellovibrionales bacterium RIFOXYB1_FULL_37_110]|nr:MAG: phosphonate ABC transporter ATP-binding protein [Bdellovibrionales bacterium RIFOXYC1_FULL_37_79]OFZ57764.1 MAG: phosphonate ABC transporter ATP-binding protein [Bdellovibrionales bacterium RIFOXYB1_FULL_37_110]OFZ58378.1 MAG: phosphonate ABC transporter ATP-binding protein [Bdellovibrionales bacterium RIFOXYB2_FULL_36_6]OFZ62730.1 MAG: phosphonate ABC transporter ATP-binding protein [Bdellovibrionales bacterium RIFOXYD1_FULL_36_51]
MSIVSVQNLTKIFPRNTCALNKVSFQIDDNIFLAILGPSGAGKSTLLRSINRLVTPTSGKIFLNDQDITLIHGKKLSMIRKNIGMIFQQYNLIERLDVLTNVLIGSLYMQTPFNKLRSCLLHTFSKQEKIQGLDCLSILNLMECAHQRVDTLSGGQKQRVAIARTLMQNPRIILADEPVASLDPVSTAIVLDYLKKIHITKNIPVIINLHQADLAKKYAQRIIGMNSGEIVFDGNLKNLTNDQLSVIYQGSQT